MGVNDRHIGTSSGKLKKMSMLLKFVHEKIIDNQEIKRFVFYSTKNPLSLRGITYKNEKVDQPDVVKSQVEKLITILPFNPDMAQTLESFIFLNIPNGRFDKNGNILYLDCYIISPSEYMEIAEGLRIHEISQRVADIFDDMRVNDKAYEDELGNLKFELASFNNERVSKTNSMLLSVLRFKVELNPLSRVKR